MYGEKKIVRFRDAGDMSETAISFLLRELLGGASAPHTTGRRLDLLCMYERIEGRSGSDKDRVPRIPPHSSTPSQKGKHVEEAVRNCQNVTDLHTLGGAAVRIFVSMVSFD